MRSLNGSASVGTGVHPSQRPLAVARGPCAQRVCVLHLVGGLQAPLTGELRHMVHALLRRGKRTIVLDLAGVSSIDAAGVGQLVRAYNVTRAAHGGLRIANATAWVREVLQRASLFHVLSAGRE